MSWALIRSSAFVRAARKHIRRHPEYASDLFEVFTQLAEDPFHPSLRSHKLTGTLVGSWACSAGYDLRVVFKIVKQAGKSAILLEALGTHDEVY
ncbi:MAG: type II toxin-antitoxin system mRNA interferase toxin, RelE/StbE family [bacterium]